MIEPLISILIPFKDTSMYLPECLDSILKQTHEHWELLIVDDNSTDSSYSVVQDYANENKRIRLFSNPGNGIIEALRHAYSMSRGDLITRMDSDDIMTPNKLQTLCRDLMQHGKGHIALGQVTYFSRQGIGAGYKSYEQWLNRLIETGNNYSEIYKECVIPSPCWMLFRDDLDAIGAFNPSRYPEDYDLTFRCYENDIQCIPSKKVLHQWRDYSTRASRTDPHYAQNYFLEIKLDYFLKLDFEADRPLTVWGAGSKGKSIAKALSEKGITFYWICDNPNKIGHEIHGQTLLNFDYLSELKNPQCIITVANPTAQKDIKEYMSSKNARPMVDYFFFC